MADTTNIENNVNYYDTAPVNQPVAQARKKLNLRLIFTEIDKPFFVLVMVLVVFGLVMMFSASYGWGLADTGDGTYYLKRQAFAGGIGIAAMLLLSVFDYHFFQNTKIVYLGFIVVFGVCIATLFIGTETANARRWIDFGFIQFQPSELLKVTFILVFAYIMAVNFPKFKDWRYCVLPFIIILGMVGGVLVLQRHMSAVMLVGIIGICMMYVSGMPSKTFWLFIGVIILAGLIVGGLRLLAGGSGFSYISERIQSWRNPESDPQGSTWQTYQSLLAIGSGGWNGLGFGESRQKFLYLPESQNDFVFSIVCEELGFIGGLIVVLLFVMFIFKGFQIASHAKDRFGTLVAAGITIQIGSQAFFNIMVACNAFPNTGIALPFFSYGGTALMIQMAEMGIMLNISRQANMKK